MTYQPTSQNYNDYNSFKIAQNQKELDEILNKIKHNIEVVVSGQNIIDLVKIKNIKIHPQTKKSLKDRISNIKIKDFVVKSYDAVNPVKCKKINNIIICL